LKSEVDGIVYVETEGTNIDCHQLVFPLSRCKKIYVGAVQNDDSLLHVLTLKIFVPFLLKHQTLLARHPEKGLKTGGNLTPNFSTSQGFLE